MAKQLEPGIVLCSKSHGIEEQMLQSPMMSHVAILEETLYIVTIDRSCDHYIKLGDEGGNDLVRLDC